jgi:hypothetical protein
MAASFKKTPLLAPLTKIGDISTPDSAYWKNLDVSSTKMLWSLNFESRNAMNRLIFSEILSCFPLFSYNASTCSTQYVNIECLGIHKTILQTEDWIYTYLYILSIQCYMLH